uniref:SLC2A4 regulator n=1 Tax=Spermophilus dauricus TaxID=99837 RepID=A0A8C9PK36_SPEDA
MGQPVPLALPTLWVLGCFSLLLWLWVLCTACHRHRARLQGSMMPVQVVSARQTRFCSLSRSGTRLQELHRGPHSSIVSGQPILQGLQV